MSDKRSGSDRDTSRLPRERLWDRLRRTVGLQPDTKHHTTSLPNRSSREYSPLGNDNDGRKSVQVESTKRLQTIAATGPQAGSKSVGHEKVTDVEQRAKLQDKNEDRPVTKETSVNSTAQKGDSKENGGTAGIKTREPEDFWALAEKQLRQPDSDRGKVMKKFDAVLEKPENFGSKLEPPRSNARRKQINEFLESRIKKLENAKSQNHLSQCKEMQRAFSRLLSKF